jgi:hypothetical protein
MRVPRTTQARNYPGFTLDVWRLAPGYYALAPWAIGYEGAMDAESEGNLSGLSTGRSVEFPCGPYWTLRTRLVVIPWRLRAHLITKESNISNSLCTQVPRLQEPTNGLHLTIWQTFINSSFSMASRKPAGRQC